MLVLSRRNGEEILVGDNVIIKVLSLARGKVQVGIEAPPEVSIKRSEIAGRMPKAHDRRMNPTRRAEKHERLLAGAAL